MPKGVYIRTDEAKFNMSKSHIGQVPWNKGKKSGLVPWNKNKNLSDEHKERVSKGVLNSEKFIKHINELIHVTEEHKREVRTLYRRKTKDKIKKWKRDDYLKHKERYIERAKLHYQEHIEEKKEYSRKYQEDNLPKVLEKLKEWNLKNPEKKRVYGENRRARKKAGGGNVTLEEIREQYDLQGGLCYWCGKAVNNKYHIDHLIPLSRGGTHSINNIAITCPKCNISKNNKTPEEYKIYLASKGSSDKNEMLKQK